MDTNALSDFTQEELIDIKQRVESWPDYKKQNYTAIFGEILSVDFCMTQ